MQIVRRVLFLGNCQMGSVAKLIRFAAEPGAARAAIEYAPNTERIDPNFNPQEALELAAAADVVVSQPVQNLENPLRPAILRKVAKEVIFAPYIYLDGLFGMVQFRGGGIFSYGRILGEDTIRAALDEAELTDVTRDFVRGELDFRNKDRLMGTMAELRRRESACDVTTSDVIEDMLAAGRTPIYAHNHPSNPLLHMMAQRIAAMIGLETAPLARLSPLQTAQVTLQMPLRSFSPYDIEALGLPLEPDSHWAQRGRELIRLIAAEKFDKAR